MAKNLQLTQKDLGVLSDLLTYEQWAGKKCCMYAQTLTDPALQGLCKSMEENHKRNYNDLYNFLNAF